MQSDNPISKKEGVSPGEALERLIAGNTRFLDAKSKAPSLKQSLLGKQAKGQAPYATILGCSDSRAPPELIFDAWLGELFVIRVAGNVLGASTLGTLQYAARHLHTPLFVVLGHEGCGAVEAALGYLYDGQKHPERIESLLQEIVPAIKQVNPNQEHSLMLSQAVEANVRANIKTLSETPEAQLQIANGCKLIGAIYDIESGVVRFLD